MDTIKVVTAVAAVIAAGGSVASAAAAFYNARNTWREKQRKLRVIASIGAVQELDGRLTLVRPDFQSEYGKIYRDVLGVFIANPSNKTVIVTSPIVRVSKNFSILIRVTRPEVKFPLKLEEGSNVLVPIAVQSIADRMVQFGYKNKVRVRLEVSDGSGTAYRSKKVSLDVHERERPEPQRVSPPAVVPPEVASLPAQLNQPSLPSEANVQTQ